MLRRTDGRYTLPWYGARLAATMAADPIESFYRARTRVIAWARPSEPCHAYAIDHAWRRTLGDALGLVRVLTGVVRSTRRRAAQSKSSLGSKVKAPATALRQKGA